LVYQYIASFTAKIAFGLKLPAFGTYLLWRSQDLEQIKFHISHSLLMPETNFEELLYISTSDLPAILPHRRSAILEDNTIRSILPSMSRILYWDGLYGYTAAYDKTVTREAKETIDSLMRVPFSQWEAEVFYRSKKELRVMNGIYICDWLLNIASGNVIEDLDIFWSFFGKHQSQVEALPGQSFRQLLICALEEIFRLRNSAKIIPSKYVSQHITRAITQETNIALESLLDITNNLRILAVQDVSWSFIRRQLIIISKNIIDLIIIVRSARRELANLSIQTKGQVNSTLLQITAISSIARSTNNSKLSKNGGSTTSNARQLIDILQSVSAGTLDAKEAEMFIANQPELTSFVHSIMGNEIKMPNTIISFGQNNNVGDISIRDVVAGNMIHLTVNITNMHNKP